MTNTLAIYIEDMSRVDMSVIKNIKNFMSTEYEDFCIISDNNDIFDQQYPVILSIYLQFFRGDIVFIEPECCIQKLDSLIANQVFLYADIDTVLGSGISRKNLKNIKLLTYTNNVLNIEVINNVTV